jgi:hypothetical protein
MASKQDTFGGLDQLVGKNPPSRASKQDTFGGLDQLVGKNPPSSEHGGLEDLVHIPTVSHPVKAVLTGPGGDSTTLNSENLNRIGDEQIAESKPGVVTGLVGGALNGATLGFGDELGGVVSALRSDSTPGSNDTFLDRYRKARDENRQADQFVRQERPVSYFVGQLGGALATAPLLGPAAGPKGLLTTGNFARAGASGALAGLGNSEGDLTKGEIGRPLLDTTVGAGTGLITNALLGAAGNRIASAPARVAVQEDNGLIRQLSSDAPTEQVEQLLGENSEKKPVVLQYIKASDDLKDAIKKKEFGKAAEIAKAQRMDAVGGQVGLHASSPSIDVMPIIEELDSQESVLSHSLVPEERSEAEDLRRLSNALKERYVSTSDVVPTKAPAPAEEVDFLRKQTPSSEGKRIIWAHLDSTKWPTDAKNLAELELREETAGNLENVLKSKVVAKNSPTPTEHKFSVVEALKNPKYQIGSMIGVSAALNEIFSMLEHPDVADKAVYTALAGIGLVGLRAAYPRVDRVVAAMVTLLNKGATPSILSRVGQYAKLPKPVSDRLASAVTAAAIQTAASAVSRKKRSTTPP